MLNKYHLEGKGGNRQELRREKEKKKKKKEGKRKAGRGEGRKDVTEAALINASSAEADSGLVSS